MSKNCEENTNYVQEANEENANFAKRSHRKWAFCQRISEKHAFHPRVSEEMLISQRAAKQCEYCQKLPIKRKFWQRYARKTQILSKLRIQSANLDGC